jgi:hypothetical protein
MGTFPTAFRQVHIGTHATQTSSGTAKGVNNGFLLDAGVPSVELSNNAAPFALGVGVYGFFDPNTWTSVNVASGVVTTGQPLVLASSSIYANDKIGPFHGGYKESNKSKKINPRFVEKFYRVDPCTPQANIVHVGNTNYTSSLSPSNPACCFQFMCGETYYLRIDVKGSPALRYLNHNAYHTLDYYTGCCADPTPEPIDSTLVMIGWAQQIIDTPYLNPFISPVVYDQAGDPWFAPGTTVDADGAAVTEAQWWTNYSSPGYLTGQCAGLRMQGAYVDTVFGNCSFQLTDFFEKEPIKILASLVDYTGDPCVFEGICFVTECNGLQGMGFGETIIRDLALSEEYNQNSFHSDIRLREITQGNDLFGAINRASLYTRYHLYHSVPRPMNPTSQFDNDRYEIVIITNGISTPFQTFMSTWIGACGCNQVALQTFGCTPCTPVAIQ